MESDSGDDGHRPAEEFEPGGLSDQLNVRELSEEELFEERIYLGPCVLAEAPRLLVFGVLFLCGVLLTIFVPLSVLVLKDPAFSLSLSFPLGLIPAVVFALKIAYDLCNERYTIARDYVRTVNGLLNLTKSDLRVKCHDIRGVDIERSIFGRLLNTGDLLIGSALNSEMEFRLRGIFNPSLYRDIILERAERELQRISHDETPHSRDSRYVAIRE